ncbi:MAG TPA: hypothetical protein VNM15_05215 [Candidatus Binatia bacterium]|nr:hypothetical protein [Candidatus Binatia bacterium]
MLPKVHQDLIPLIRRERFRRIVLDPFPLDINERITALNRLHLCARVPVKGAKAAIDDVPNPLLFFSGAD